MKEKRQIERIFGLLIVICILSSNILDQKNTLGLNFKLSTVTYEDTDGTAFGIFVDGDYAYLADGDSGLAVLNISDPTDPGTPVYEDTDGSARGVFVDGDCAYLADGDSGLAVLNISDPTDPGTPVYEDTSGSARGVFVDGDFAYVADGNSGLAVIDISDPTNPGIPIYENTSGFAYGVFVEGDFAYVADGNSGLAVIDISDPTNPGMPIYEDTTGSANGVFIEGDYAYVADGNSGLAVIGIYDPTNPGIPVYEDTNGTSYGVSVSGNRAYIADGTNGLAFIDITYPTDPEILANEITNATAYSVYLSGDCAYIADEVSGLAVIVISYPTDPGMPIYEATTGSAYGVYVSGDYAYVADGMSGLAVIDISDPTNPGIPVYEDTTVNAGNVFVSGDYAYIADRAGGFAVINISDPTNPGIPVYGDSGNAVRNLHVSGDYAYLADGNSLAVIDISDPTNPGTPIFVETTDYVYDVYISGDHAYVANHGLGLAVIDISDPTNPGTPVYRGLDGWPYNVGAEGVYVSGNYAYIAIGEVINGRGGLAIFDISDPTNPGSPIYEASIGWAEDVYVSGDYAYLADGTGLAVIDISDPTNPETSFYSYTSSHASGVFMSGDYAYVADRNSGLAAIKVKALRDFLDPIIITSPNSVFLELGYSGESISWTATDSNPSTYTILNGSSDVVVEPAAWSSDVAVTYDIPDGLEIGTYTYTINFTDGFEHYTTNTVLITVKDTTAPVIINPPEDLILELGYSGKSISWAAIDLKPRTYTILNGSSEIIAGPTLWSSGVAVTYDIPDGLETGIYSYTINFTDTSYNSDLDTVLITIQNNAPPVFTVIPDDLILELGYSGANISWTATDLNPSTYTILNSSSEIIAGAVPWSSGIMVSLNLPDGLEIGTYTYTINFTDIFGNYNLDTVFIIVQDTTAPIIITYPDDLFLELGYSGANISWNATDQNPSTYTILNGSFDIIVGPSPWLSGIMVTFDIPDDLEIGTYVYTINFTDIFGNFNTDTVLITVQDTTAPNIATYPDDLFLELGYSEASISWTATDLNPSTYTILNSSSDIIVGPSPWLSGIMVTFNIPDGLEIGTYTYIIVFMDIYANFNISVVFITVKDTTAPIITTYPYDLFLELGYSGANISWNATDQNPSTYTILNSSSDIIVGPSPWLSGIMVTFDIPDDLEIGTYVYTINFTDIFGNFNIDTVLITVQDTTAPIITIYPDDIILELGYSGESISWTATDLNPSTYTILNGSSDIIAGPTSWLSGSVVTYDIPDGLGIGTFTYIINFTDVSYNFNIDTILIIVQNSAPPIITTTPTDVILELGYSGESISWTATDLSPGSYTILNGTSDIIAGPTPWSSNVMVTYDIPEGLGVGSYSYTINFTDIFGNFNTNTVFITVQDTTAPNITNYPGDVVLELGYSGESISWTATDLSPGSYTILNGTSDIIAGPTPWSSNVMVTYYIPDGLGIGIYTYIINITDIFGNFNTDTFSITVEDTLIPTWDTIPEDQTIEIGMNFLYDVNGSDLSGIDTYWLNDTVNFQIDSDGVISNNTFLLVGEYWLEVSVNDTLGNNITEIIKITVQDTTFPTWIEVPSDQIVEFGSSFYYDVDASDLSGIDIYWINDTVNFHIDINGIITNNIALSEGEYWLEIRAYDPYENFIANTIKITVISVQPTPPESIPGYNIFIIMSIISISIIILIIWNKKKFYSKI